MTTTALPEQARTAVEALVWRALDTVNDPELDEPVTTLRFVDAVEVSRSGATEAAEVLVVLRLPTYFCSPNFAFMMVADAYDAVRAVPGVGAVTVRLDDHFASDEINAGVAGGLGFQGSFPTMAEAELQDLRLTFWRKAHKAAQERVASAVLRAGRDRGELVGLALGEAPAGRDLDRLRRRRADLGLPSDDAAPLLLDDAGQPIRSIDLTAQLRMARTTRISIEGNSALCRGLLSVRYDLPGPGPEERETA